MTVFCSWLQFVRTAHLFNRRCMANLSDQIHFCSNNWPKAQCWMQWHLQRTAGIRCPQIVLQIWWSRPFWRTVCACLLFVKFRQCSCCFTYVAQGVEFRWFSWSVIAMLTRCGCVNLVDPASSHMWTSKSANALYFVFMVDIELVFFSQIRNNINNNVSVKSHEMKFTVSI